MGTEDTKVEEPHTQHFWLHEWVCIDGTPYPPEWVELRWFPLARALDELRNEVDSPITITPHGGYRTPAVNARIGGAHDSQHLHGRAADIQCRSLSAKQLHDVILEIHQRGRMKDLGGLGFYPAGFVHVDVRQGVGHLAMWTGGRTIV